MTGIRGAVAVPSFFLHKCRNYTAEAEGEADFAPDAASTPPGPVAIAPALLSPPLAPPVYTKLQTSPNNVSLKWRWVYNRAMKASERAYASLRDDILNWRLLPGAPLAEIEVAERLGVSRTPVREALGRLAADGLVESRGRVDIVADLGADHLSELFELREALDTQAARLAARRRDAGVFQPLRDDFARISRQSSFTEGEREAFYATVDRFDEAIMRATGNTYLQTALRALRVHLVRARRLSRENPERMARAAAEHLIIADAILAQNETLAVQATAVHLHSSLVNVMETLRPARSPEPTGGPSPAATPEMES